METENKHPLIKIKQTKVNFNRGKRDKNMKVHVKDEDQSAGYEIIRITKN